MKHFNNQFNILLALLLSLCLWTSCHNHEHHNHDEDNKTTNTDVAEHEVTLSNEQCDMIGLEVQALEFKNIAQTIKLSGKLEVPAQNKAEVSSLSDGVLSNIFVHPGSEVSKGQLIAEITNTQLSGLQQDYLNATAQLKLAQIEYDRQTELVNANAAPLKNLQKANADLERFKNVKSAITQQLAALGVSTSSLNANSISNKIQLRAPISGTISDIHGKIGSKVDAASPLATIVNNKQLHLDLFVYEKDLPYIQKGQIIHFTLTNNPGKEFDAKIFSIGTAFADESKTVPVHAEVLAQKNELIEGMNVTAVVSVGDHKGIAVPESAIATENNQHYLFIQKKRSTSERTFEKIRIVKGISELGYTEVQLLSPLDSTVEYVSKGILFLTAKLSGTEEAHVH